MKSLILIPSYLWKNTLKRWFENLISPLSKILIPVLLSLLAILILVFFIEMERQLRDQLKSNDSYSVFITERILPNDKTDLTPELLIDEQILWGDKYSLSAINYVRQPLLMVQWEGSISVPVIVYTHLDNAFIDVPEKLGAPPALFLSRAPKPAEVIENLKYDDVFITATHHPLPQYIYDQLDTSHVLAIPIEMADNLMSRGFTISTHARLGDFDEVESFLTDTEAFYRAENRKIKVFSAFQILKTIEEFQKIQRYVRLGIVFSCGLILSVILGTIAWLEFRQELYLTALLRSFGTPRLLLLFHVFFENLILVTLGIGISLVIWRPLYKAFQNKIEIANLSMASRIELPFHDASIIVLAGLLGVIIAMIPIAIGLRKQTGLILQ